MKSDYPTNGRGLCYIVGTVAFLFLMLVPNGVAHAYIGPGAGFALFSSFLIFFVAFLLGIMVLATLPIRILVRVIRRRNSSNKRKCARTVIIGLDGMSPVLAESMMKDGLLPNLSRLAETGTFRQLRSTIPSASPVAWSTFQTGTNPGKHNIFDFLTRNKQTYMPELSSAQVRPSRRTLRLGKYRIPLGKPTVSLLRKSEPFWKILGDHGIFSVVLRVPITFPPEKFRGLLLSGMSVPDLRGSQGSFTYFTTETAVEGQHTGGMQITMERQGNEITSAIPGPPHPLKPDAGVLEVPFTLTLNDSSNEATLKLPGEKLKLKTKNYSRWVRLNFRAGLGVNVQGICRFYLKEISPHTKLYVTPINIDPDKPALSLSHPFVYASYLAKTCGPYSTLGLAEDTWALNEKIIDEDTFLKQVHLIHDEREKIFFDALSKTDRGMVASVFDATDRVQHMFWRFTPEARGIHDPQANSKHANVIEEMYKRMDEMVGRTMAKLGKNDILIVMSDHGFGSFRRCVNLNAWLKEHGFLTLKDGKTECDDYFQDVDWSRTKAYAVGLGGIFINQVEREAQGIVHKGEEKQAVKKAIMDGLDELRDVEMGKSAVNCVYDTAEYYSGPYADNAPDLVVGFADGYRASWDSVTGKFGSTIIEDNEKAWSGDHCIDPSIMHGVFFCNRSVNRELPGIIDIAPTVLDAFGVPIPRYMEGEALFSESSEPAPTGSR